jgi:hypothetical protein
VTSEAPRASYLAEHGPTAASTLGAVIWRDRPRGHVVSSNGGGDYAKQMLLGRMRRAGLVCTIDSEGSSRWDVTPRGRQAAQK